MLSNEDLFKISMLLDSKLGTVKKDMSDDMEILKSDIRYIKNNSTSDFKKVSQTSADNISPCLQKIGFNDAVIDKHYQSRMNQMREIKADIDLIKKVLDEHSERIQKLEISRTLSN